MAWFFLRRAQTSYADTDSKLLYNRSMSRNYIALFNYGGGIRGIIPAVIMSEIEKKTGLHMADMVDIFCGPSTGSILNAALVRPNRRNPKRPQYKASHMVRFYEREGASIFPNDRFREFRGLLHDVNNRTIKFGTLSRLMKHGHYDNSYLKHALYRLYGDAKIDDCLKSIIIPFYNLAGDNLSAEKNQYDRIDGTSQLNIGGLEDGGGRSVWMKRLRAPSAHAKTHKPMDAYLYDVVMASCSAPTYFPCHDFKARDPESREYRHYHAIDGSVFDNPCISYHGAIRRQIPEDQKVTMICLGTGHTGRAIHKDEWNKYGALGVVDPAHDHPLINIFFHASESALMETFAQDLSGHFFMFNKTLHDSDGNSPSMQIDDATPENIQKLKKFALEIIEENKSDFETVCDMLVRNYEDEKPDSVKFLDGMKKRMSLFKDGE